MARTIEWEGTIYYGYPEPACEGCAFLKISEEAKGGMPTRCPRIYKSRALACSNGSEFPVVWMTEQSYVLRRMKHGTGG